jgi:DNA (cytosine-5)-methyltransferase 1
MRGRSQNVARAAFRLAASYPQNDLGNPTDPLDDLLYIILSGQTNERNYQATFLCLKAAFPKWKGLSNASVGRIANLIRGGGLAQQKARYIREVLKRIETDFGKPSLDALAAWTTEKAESYLSELPGVGIKSARCVLMYTLGREVFPADVNCLRTMDRLGWIDWKGKRGELLADAAQSIVPAPLRRNLHIGLIQHARQVCAGRKPLCGDCCLAELCRHSSEKQKRRPVVVDLCCGAGGFSWGFMQAGFEVLLGVDQCKNALATFALNIPGAQTLAADVTARETLKEIRRKLSGRQPTVVIAGPPCQGFSRAGPRKSTDPRNAVLRASMKLAVDLAPDVIIFENVLNVRAEPFVHHFDKTMAVARRAGYRFSHAILRAEAFGVAQSRKRVVLIATKVNDRDELVATLSDLENRPPVPNMNVAVALSGIPSDAAIPTAIKNHSPMEHSRKVVAKIKRIEPGTGPLSYRKLHPDRLAPTLICGHRALPCHYAAARTITAREAARIQGFPDEYVFEGSRGHQMLQVANAVPPRVSLGIATAVASLLEVEIPAQVNALIEEVLLRPTFHPVRKAAEPKQKTAEATKQH